MQRIKKKLIVLIQRKIFIAWLVMTVTPAHIVEQYCAKIVLFLGKAPNLAQSFLMWYCLKKEWDPDKISNMAAVAAIFKNGRQEVYLY